MPKRDINHKYLCGCLTEWNQVFTASDCALLIQVQGVVAIHPGLPL